jgi:hypothetical protein
MAVKIPVFVASDYSKPVGIAEIDENGDVVIRISSNQLLKNIEHLATIDSIHGLALGVEYKVAQPKEPNGR